MSQVLELSDDTYQQLTNLAQRQRRPVEEMLRLCLAAYEEALYERAHQQMLADGVLVSLPAPPLLPGETDDEDFEPIAIAGRPLSEIIRAQCGSPSIRPSWRTRKCSARCSARSENGPWQWSTPSAWPGVCSATARDGTV
jgi:hypothetical protein